MVKKISGQEFKEAENSKIAVVDFSATWCGPCKMLAPVLEEVSQELGEQVSFFNVDVDENQDLAIRFGVQSIPMIAVLKDGKLVAQQVGFQPKENISRFIQSHMN